MLRRYALALMLSAPLFAVAQEVCNNALDDDNDGAIDLNDTECPCSTLIAPPDIESFIVNHSFEERELTVQGTPCCPYGWVSGVGPEWFGDCALDWSQATEATSDYYHECGLYPATFPFPPPDGVAAVGFISYLGYMEYVGACLTVPVTDPHPLLAGTTYTLSLWVSMFAATGGPSQNQMASYGVYYEDPFPLALYGSANCVPFPIPTLDCIGYMPGWQELGRVYHQPNGQWERVSFTFTPGVDIRSVIIGSACDLPASFGAGTVQGPNGPVGCLPYTLVDDLILTEAVQQVLTPVKSVGHLCQGTVVVMAAPPPGATDHQWYLNGVAVVGQTGTTLNVSALGLGGGTYTLASTYAGQCLMGSTNVAVPSAPEPWSSILPITGCAPLEVAFADTTQPATITSEWSFGDGAHATGSAVTHTYTAAGTYDVTLTVADSHGCEGDSTRIGAVVVIGAPTGVLSATPNPTDVENTTVVLSAAGSGGDIVSWWWDLGAVPPGSSDDETLTVYFPAEPGSYPVTLVVRSTEGCVDTVHSHVVVTLDGDVEMPNVFSPNGDGHNDRFVPLELVAGATGTLNVFNRWGELVFNTTTLMEGWNGRANGGDVPEGTYYYTVVPAEGEEEAHSGHVTLVR